MDVWAQLTVIPTYHKTHCCQARGRKIDRWAYYNDEQWKDRACRGTKSICDAVYCKDRKQLAHNVLHGEKTCMIHTVSPQSSHRPRPNCWAALTSLNSWIWACSNMENTLELAPSAVLFLAFLGAFWHRGKEMTQAVHTRLSEANLRQHNTDKTEFTTDSQKKWWWKLEITIGNNAET